MTAANRWQGLHHAERAMPGGMCARWDVPDGM